MNRTDRIRTEAVKGIAEAEWALGVLLEEGYGLQQDSDEARQWFTRAAEQGLAIAQFDLAHWYWRQAGATTIDGDGMMWCRKAAENGLTSAQHVLGVLYLSLQTMPSQKAEGIVWLERAAEGGDRSAALYLGEIFKWGLHGQEKDPHRAVKLAEMGDALGEARCTFELAKFLERGVGVEKNHVKALYLYEKAASLGLGIACFRLSNIYKSGLLGVEKDEIISKNYSEKFLIATVKEREQRRAFRQKISFFGSSGDAIRNTTFS